ncbi:unnamed protein product [Didymodactylos carnosus]|nr:unnamed protein product [Didymodactylos carnosus]CAF4336529.1 unnamed protein product [Didymodactylos carnosus]
MTNSKQQSAQLYRSTSTMQSSSCNKPLGNQQQRKKASFHVNPVYSSYNENRDYSTKNANTNGNSYYSSSNQMETTEQKKQILSQQTQTLPSILANHNDNSNLNADAPTLLNHYINGHNPLRVLPSSDNRRNTIQCNDIDFSVIRAMKRFEIERDLLLQTCDTMERVKCFLTDKLSEMKEKQRYYCLKLSTSQFTGITAEPVYNRDLVADLLKLAHNVLNEAQYDTKKSDQSSSSQSSSSFGGSPQVTNNGITSYHSQSNHYQQSQSTPLVNPDNNNVVKIKNDRINQLENEKRIIIQELIELRKMSKKK